MTEKPTVLVAEDDEAMRDLLTEVLTEAGYRVISAADGREALERLSQEPVDVIITDHRMPRMPGRELLDEVRLLEPDIPVIIITAFGSIGAAVDAMRAGAHHFLPKPFSMEDLLRVVEDVLRDRATERELRVGSGSLSAAFPGLVADCPAMKRALALLARSAPVETPVLLVGETGTGKELFARLLHSENGSRKGAFVAVNCSAIPENLLESQLFGHRRGAFTDARDDRRGLFQEAEGGTILLDEIGDMPLPLQGKLLRVLQEREVQPLGAAAPLPIDVRVVAATHRDLVGLVGEGRFRQDLYYRLNVISIEIPPLRERREDLVPLIAHMLEKHGQKLGKPGRSISPGALELLRRHSWPGNVRELENVIERALVLGTRDVIEPADLPHPLRARGVATPDLDAAESMADMEREHILRTLRAAGGNKASAARKLGLDRKTLYRKLKQYKISD